MKKRISVLLALMMLLGILSGCGGTTQSEETDPNEGDDGTIKIGLSMFTQEFPFYVSMQEAFEEACAENGYELISTNASMDISKQIDGCMDMLSKGVDALAITSWYGDALLDVFEAAEKQRFPFS